MEKLISAVIGCGRMGAFTSDDIRRYSPACWLPLSHIEALLESSNVSLKAVCDVTPDLLDKAKAAYGIEYSYTSYQELITEIKPDLLCIATRTPERTDIIKYGIAAGVKAFHIEKPLCNSIEQLDSLERVLQEKSVLFSYGTIRRYFSIYQQAKKLVDSGKLGKLQQVQINFGAAPLFWSHPHSVDLILFFAGQRDLLSVQAKLDNVVIGEHSNYIESDPIISLASMYFDDGVTGVINRASGMDVVLSCEKGEVIIEADGRGIICRTSSEEDPYYPYPCDRSFLTDSGPEGTYAAINSLVEALGCQYAEREFDKKHIFLGQRVLFAFVQSHIQNGQLTPIEDLDPSIFVLAKSGYYVA